MTDPYHHHQHYYVRHHTNHHHHTDHRDLFDEDYVIAGCPPSEYDNDTSIDNTVGTWATNYGIAAVGLVGFIYFCVYHQQHRRQQQQQQQLHWVGLYFAGQGIGYGIAGVGHQLYDSNAAKSYAWEIVSYAFVGTGILALQWHVARTVKYRVILTVICLACLGLTFGLQTLLVVGAYTLVSLFGLGVYSFGWKKRDWFASAGCLVYFGGTIFQVAVADACGQAAYKDNCFANCPLPDPMTFNHNAIFHVLVIAGMVLQLFGTYTVTTATTTTTTTSSSSSGTEERVELPGDVKMTPAVPL